MEVAAEIKGVLVLLDGFKSAYGGVADGEGFEPSVHCCTHAFQACAFDHSATHPESRRQLNTFKLRPASRGGGGRPKRAAFRAWWGKDEG